MMEFTKVRRPRAVRNLKGQRFGKLVVVEFVGMNKVSYWKCLCDCGSEVVVMGRSLEAGATRSCGKHRSDVEDVFWAKIIKSAGCWSWSGRKIHGYGALMHKGKQWLAHRFSYVLHKGKIDKGLFVLHKCDNPECCNPDHLFLGTQQDNVKDRDDKERMCRGSVHPRAVLTKEQVVEIYKSYHSGMGYRRLAKKYGVCCSSIRCIISGKSWKHITCELVDLVRSKSEKVSP